MPAPSYEPSSLPFRLHVWLPRHRGIDNAPDPVKIPEATSMLNSPDRAPVVAQPP
jgi:hypothetical protein